MERGNSDNWGVLFWCSVFMVYLLAKCCELQRNVSSPRFFDRFDKYGEVVTATLTCFLTIILI